MKIHLSYSDQPSQVSVRGEQVQVKPYQIIVWVSLTVRNVLELAADVPMFPAILDTGHNHNFSIQSSHLIRWAGIQPEQLAQWGKTRVGDQTIPLRSASLWLRGAEPFRMNLDEGAAVHPDAGPRLPLLGLRALTLNKLRALLKGDRMEAMIRTAPKWYWPF